MSIHIEIDFSDVEKELNRIIDGPGTADIIEFEGILATQFQITQQAVHIITGSLKGSGKLSSVKSPNRWEGKLTYGGASAGFIHNPVEYAHYEQERDGTHDFMEPIYSLDSRYGEALEDWLIG